MPLAASISVPHRPRSHAESESGGAIGESDVPAGECSADGLASSFAYMRTREGFPPACGRLYELLTVTTVDHSVKWRESSDKIRGCFPRLAALLDVAEAVALAHMAFPNPYTPVAGRRGPTGRTVVVDRIHDLRTTGTGRVSCVTISQVMLDFSLSPHMVRAWTVALQTASWKAKSGRRLGYPDRLASGATALVHRDERVLSRQS